MDKAQSGKEFKLSPEQERAAESAARAAMAATQAPDYRPPKEPIEILAPLQVYRADDLVVWKHTLPGIEYGVSPLTMGSPDTVLYDDVVIAGLFLPPCLVAVSKQTGEQRWLYPLTDYGKQPVLAADVLIGGTTRSLPALSPTTGERLWEYVPHKKRGEWIYSRAVFAGDALFVGDRAGYLHCLSMETGGVRWKVKTSAGANNDVNATALAFEDLILTANNSKLVLAYDQATGQEVWRQRLADCSTDEIQWYGGMALVQTPQVLYGLCPRTGEILRKWHWEDTEIRGVAVAGSVLCIALTNAPWIRLDKMPENPWTELWGIQGETVLWRLPYPRHSRIAFRWDSERCLLYEALYQGLGIVDVATGKRLAMIEEFEPSLLHRIDSVGLPCTDADHLYVLHDSGSIWALRHPVLPDPSGQTSSTGV